MRSPKGRAPARRNSSGFARRSEYLATCRDYILLCTPTKAEIADLTNLISPVSEGYEVVIGRRRVGPVVTRSPLNSILFSLFRAIFRLLTGTPYAKEHPSFRLFSRAAALHLVASSDAEVRIRANEIGPGFPVKLVDLPDVAEKLGMKW